MTTFHGSDAWVPWQRKVSWLVARRTQPIAVAPVIAASLGVHDAPIIPCAVDLDAVCAGRPRRGPARAGLADGQALRAVSRGARRPLRRSVEQARRRLRRDDRAAAPKRPGVFAASLDGLSREEVALAMNAADVAVITSMWEGAPVVVKESLACRTPVVSVAVGDVSAVVDGLPGCAIVPRDPGGAGGGRRPGAAREPRPPAARVHAGLRTSADRRARASACIAACSPGGRSDDRRAPAESRVRLPEPRGGRRRAAVGDPRPRPGRAGLRRAA